MPPVLVAKFQRRECTLLTLVPSYRSIQLFVQGRITFTLAELDGVPGDVISGYTQHTDGDRVLCEVTFRTPDIFPIVSVIWVLIFTLI